MKRVAHCEVGNSCFDEYQAQVLCKCFDAARVE